MSWLTRLGFGVVAAASLLSPREALAESATASVGVRAAFSARSVLSVSSTTLDFSTITDHERPTAVVSVSVSARTRRDGDVLLFIEPMWSGGEAWDGELLFTGSGDGLADGRLVPDARLLVGRWTGSGRRSGTLTFELPAAVDPPESPLSVHFVLTAP